MRMQIVYKCVYVCSALCDLTFTQVAQVCC